MTSVRSRAAVLVVAVLVLVTGLVTAAHAQAPTAPTGWVRLAHLSPNVPAVDVYLAPFGQSEEIVVRKAPYGAVSPYSALPPGVYTVSMRPAGAAPDSPVALSQVVEVGAGVAYSLLVFENGPGSAPLGTLVTDDLRAPAPESGRIRLVQGAADLPPLTVRAVDGPVLASGVEYGTTTGYLDVPAGRWDLELQAGAARSPATVDVRAGSITSAVVTSAPDGTLQVTPVTDSTASAAVPAGGVETGAGGTGNGLPLAAVLVAALAAGAVLVLVRPGVPARARGRHVR